MYGFCDDRNDSELLSRMTWMTMAPRCAPPAPQMLRPACSSCRSCAPNGLISPNVRHVAAVFLPRLDRRLLGQVEREPADEGFRGVVELDSRGHAVPLERGALPDQERAVGSGARAGHRGGTGHGRLELRSGTRVDLRLGGGEPVLEVLALRQDLGAETRLDHATLRALLQEHERRVHRDGWQQQREEARRPGGSPAMRGGAPRGPWGAETPRR